MPVHQQGTFGDLYVEYNVVLPSELSPEMKKSELTIITSRVLGSKCPECIELGEAFRSRDHGKDEL